MTKRNHEYDNDGVAYRIEEDNKDEVDCDDDGNNDDHDEDDGSYRFSQ